MFSIFSSTLLSATYSWNILKISIAPYTVEFDFEAVSLVSSHEDISREALPNYLMSFKSMLQKGPQDKRTH